MCMGTNVDVTMRKSTFFASRNIMTWIMWLMGFFVKAICIVMKFTWNLRRINLAQIVRYRQRGWDCEKGHHLCFLKHGQRMFVTRGVLCEINMYAYLSDGDFQYSKADLKWQLAQNYVLWSWRVLFSLLWILWPWLQLKGVLLNLSVTSTIYRLNLLGAVSKKNRHLPMEQRTFRFLPPPPVCNGTFAIWRHSDMFL